MNATKALTARLLTAAALATALAMTPPQVKAQAFSLGVQIGQPGYIHVAPRYPHEPFGFDRGYDHRSDFNRRQEFLREQAWQRDHDRRFYGNPDTSRFNDRRGW